MLGIHYKYLHSKARFIADYENLLKSVSSLIHLIHYSDSCTILTSVKLDVIFPLVLKIEIYLIFKLLITLFSGMKLSFVLCK